jgi:hypothetical protein
VVTLQAVLLAGGLVALRTGEAQEDRVEATVGETALESHESAAKQFVWASALTLALAAAALLLKKGALRRAALVTTALASVVVTGLAVRAGHAGGRLVYVHGAAAAYAGADKPGADGEARSTPAGAQEDGHGR